MALRRRSDLLVCLVGATGFEPVTSSVSANTGNRCAKRHSPRSAPTVDAEGKRSVDVQGNALFRHLAFCRCCTRCSTTSTQGSLQKAQHRG